MKEGAIEIRGLDFFRSGNVFTGSVGEFRFRISPEDGALKAYAYRTYCFEKAQDVRSEAFSLDEYGLEQLAKWLEQQCDALIK